MAGCALPATTTSGRRGRAVRMPGAGAVVTRRRAQWPARRSRPGAPARSWAASARTERSASVSASATRTRPPVLGEARESRRDGIPAPAHRRERHGGGRPHAAGGQEPEHARARRAGRSDRARSASRRQAGRRRGPSVDDRPSLGGEGGREERHAQPGALEHPVDLGRDAPAERGVDLLVEDAGRPGPEGVPPAAARPLARLLGRLLPSLGVDDEDVRARARPGPAGRLRRATTTRVSRPRTANGAPVSQAPVRSSAWIPIIMAPR